MKTIHFIIVFVFCVTMRGTAQEQWVETSSRPDGAGVTDMVITDKGTVIVTTSSWSSLAGNLGGVRRSTNDGQSWENPLDGFNGRTLHLGSNNVLFASFWPFPLEEAIYRSTDDGVNWNRLHSVSSGDNIFSINSKDNNTIIFIGTRNGVKRSTNAGSNWSYVNTGIPANSWVRDLAISSDGEIIAAATTNGMYISTNDGAAWQKVTGASSDSTITVSFLPTETEGVPEALYYATYEGEIFKSRLNDLTLADFVATLAPGELGDITPSGFLNPLVLIYRYSTDPNEPNGGVLISRDRINWEYLNSGLSADPPASAITIKSYLPGVKNIKVYLGTNYLAPDGAKIYYRDISLGISLVSSEIPDSYNLSQNYPNPFNPTTKIKFDLPAKSKTKLAVYDMLGREAAILVNGNLTAGRYEYTFDGAGLPSGVYFYRIEAEGFAEVKRMILLK